MTDKLRQVTPSKDHPAPIGLASIEVSLKFKSTDGIQYVIAPEHIDFLSQQAMGDGKPTIGDILSIVAQHGLDRHLVYAMVCLRNWLEQQNGFKIEDYIAQREKDGKL
ncbi:hypothetical protein GNAINCEL_00127 [Serratia phage KKP 3709]|nr:hypothetical protein GNAINCEL_00127 [Serratia phage KKP 3709]